MAVEAIGVICIYRGCWAVDALIVLLSLRRMARFAGRRDHLFQVVRDAVDACVAALAREVFVDALSQRFTINVEGPQMTGRGRKGKSLASVALQTRGHILLSNEVLHHSVCFRSSLRGGQLGDNCE